MRQPKNAIRWEVCPNTVRGNPTIATFRWIKELDRRCALPRRVSAQLLNRPIVVRCQSVLCAVCPRNICLRDTIFRNSCPRSPFMVRVSYSRTSAYVRMRLGARQLVSHRLGQRVHALPVSRTEFALESNSCCNRRWRTAGCPSVRDSGAVHARRATRRGARSDLPPRRLSDANGAILLACSL